MLSPPMASFYITCRRMLLACGDHVTNFDDFHAGSWNAEGGCHTRVDLHS